MTKWHSFSLEVWKVYHYLIWISTNWNQWKKELDIEFDSSIKDFECIFTHRMIHRNRIQIYQVLYSISSKLIKWVNHRALVSNENDSECVRHNIQRPWSQQQKQKKTFTLTPSQTQTATVSNSNNEHVFHYHTRDETIFFIFHFGRFWFA